MRSTHTQRGEDGKVDKAIGVERKKETREMESQRNREGGRDEEREKRGEEREIPLHL